VGITSFGYIINTTYLCIVRSGSVERAGAMCQLKKSEVGYLVPTPNRRGRNTKVRLFSVTTKSFFRDYFVSLYPMRLTDKIYNMDLSYRVVNLTIKWCEKFFTAPHIKRRRELLVMIYHSPTHQVFGQYCDKNHWLSINIHNCPTVRDLIKTTIHEYTHVCQDLKEYALMNKMVGYDKNPLEVEARLNEDTYYKNCWRSIKSKL